MYANYNRTPFIFSRKMGLQLQFSKLVITLSNIEHLFYFYFFLSAVFELKNRFICSAVVLKTGYCITEPVSLHTTA